MGREILVGKGAHPSYMISVKTGEISFSIRWCWVCLCSYIHTFDRKRCLCIILCIRWHFVIYNRASSTNPFITKSMYWLLGNYIPITFIYSICNRYIISEQSINTFCNKWVGAGCSIAHIIYYKMSPYTSNYLYTCIQHIIE